MSRGFTESIVEDAAPAWLDALGYSIAPGPVIAPGELVTTRDTLLPKLISCEVRVKHATSDLQSASP